MGCHQQIQLPTSFLVTKFFLRAPIREYIINSIFFDHPVTNYRSRVRKFGLKFVLAFIYKLK